MRILQASHGRLRIPLQEVQLVHQEPTTSEVEVERNDHLHQAYQLLTQVSLLTQPPVCLLYQRNTSKTVVHP
jgi:hypothetical protein